VIDVHSTAAAASGPIFGVDVTMDATSGSETGYRAVLKSVNAEGLYLQFDAITTGFMIDTIDLGNDAYFTVDGDANVTITGNLDVGGTLSKAAGTFKIDHPLDPANKYLYHSFVESPDMMNIYNGVVVLNKKGEAVVRMPDYFEALNQDFRYQLTSIGRFMPVFIAKEIEGNQFTIAGGKPGAKVSWQVTGIRHDAYAEAHRVQVEEDKGDKRGTYLHPELFQQNPALARK